MSDEEFASVEEAASAKGQNAASWIKKTIQEAAQIQKLSSQTIDTEPADVPNASDVKNPETALRVWEGLIEIWTERCHADLESLLCGDDLLNLPDDHSAVFDHIRDGMTLLRRAHPGLQTLYGPEMRKYLLQRVIAAERQQSNRALRKDADLSLIHDRWAELEARPRHLLSALVEELAGSQNDSMK